MKAWTVDARIDGQDLHFDISAFNRAEAIIRAEDHISRTVKTYGHHSRIEQLEVKPQPAGRAK